MSRWVGSGWGHPEEVTGQNNRERVKNKTQTYTNLKHGKHEPGEKILEDYDSMTDYGHVLQADARHADFSGSSL